MAKYNGDADGKITFSSNSNNSKTSKSKKPAGLLIAIVLIIIIAVVFVLFICFGKNKKPTYEFTSAETEKYSFESYDINNADMEQLVCEKGENLYVERSQQRTGK